MNKEARLLCLLLAVVVIAALAGCSHKPEYSEMDANRTARNQNQKQNQNSEGQAIASTPPGVEPPAAAQPAPAPPPAPVVKRPSFMDQAKGDIRDLPSYPHAYRVNMQIGPIQGVNTMVLTLKTTDPMDKITAFYERVIKDNKWTVIDKIIDPEFSEWSLKKGEDSSAKVQVKKDQQTAAMNIMIVRGEKLEEPGK
jgi:uncharacterized lipoprotein